MKKLLTIFLLGVILLTGVEKMQVVHAEPLTQKCEPVIEVKSEIVDIKDMYFSTATDLTHVHADGWYLEIKDLEITNEVVYADQIEIFYTYFDEEILGYETILGYEFH